MLLCSYNVYNKLALLVKVWKQALTQTRKIRTNAVFPWCRRMVTESCVWIYRLVATQRVVRCKASKTPPTTVLFRRTFQILSCILYDSHLAELFPSSFSLIVKCSSLLHVKKHEMGKTKSLLCRKLRLDCDSPRPRNRMVSVKTWAVFDL